MRGICPCTGVRVVLILALFLLGGWTGVSQPARAVGFDPWETGWQYRKSITIDHTKVAAALDNFPVLIDITSNDLKAPKVRSDGYDVLFMDGVGSASKLDHEIESYTAATGHLVAWARLPTLSSAADTVFYLYYGNPSADNQQNPIGVWDSRFGMTQHLDHLDQTTGKVFDSTSHHNDGTPTSTGVTQVAGVIGGASSFDGVAGRIDVPNNPDNSLNFGTGAFTISVWIKYASCGDTDITRKGNMASSPEMSYKMECMNNLLSGTLEGSNPGGGGTVSASTPYNDNNWHNAVFMRNAGTISLYVDGAVKSSQTGAGMDLTSTAIVGIGAKPPPISPGGDFFTGVIDELRYSNVALGSNWILTSYRSVTEQFATYGPEEQSGSSTYTVVFYSDPASGTIGADGVSKPDGSTGIYDVGQIVHVVADPPEGYTFSQWEVSGVTVDSTINPDAQMTVSDSGWLKAHFTQNAYALTVTVVGSGTVSKNPDQATYDYGTEVQLTATPATDWVFSAWSGDLTGGTNPTSITMTTNKAVTATFAESGTGYDFSFVWMTDTQYYSESYPTIYDGMTQWAANNKDAMKIEYVIHTGDIVNVAENAVQWQNAKHSMDILTTAGIPYGVLGGNHDGTDGFTNYQTYFGAQNHYDLITTNGVSFIIVYLSQGTDVTERAWASSIFQTYSDRIGILAVHDYIGSGGGYSGDGSALNSDIVIPNPNVWLVLCGHNGGAHLNTKTLGSRTYYELLSNYQSLANGGNGYEKIFYFDLAHSNVHVRTYSSNLAQWGGSGYGFDEFDMSLPQQTPTTYTITASAGAGGSISPSGLVNVNDGDTPIFTVTPNSGYHVLDVLVDDVSVGVVTLYTFAPVHEPHSIAASFAVDGPAMTVTGAYHGARLVWTDVGTLSYNLYYNLLNDPNTATQFAAGLTALSFDLSNLPPDTWGQTCYYWVAPVSSEGEAPRSSWGAGSDLVWMYKIEITGVTVVKNVPGDVKISVQYRSRYLGAGGIIVGIQIGEFLGPGSGSDVPNRMISIVSTRPIALLTFMSTGVFNFEASTGEFASGTSHKAWIFLWNQLPSEPGTWEAYADKAELIPIVIP